MGHRSQVRISRRAFVASLAGAVLGASALALHTTFGGNLFGRSAVQRGNSDGTLLVNGLVQHPLKLTAIDLASLPKTTVQASIRCVSSNSLVNEGSWSGVKLAYLLNVAGVSKSAVKVALYSSDGYTTDLPMTMWMADDLVVALEKDGEPLAEGLRLVAPGLWGYKCLDGLSRVTLVNHDYLGLYETLGYSDEGLFGSLMYLDTNVPSVPYSINGSVFETGSDGSSLITLENADYTISVPQSLALSDGRRVHFDKWEDGSTSPTRMVSLSATTALSASYSE